MVRKCLNLSVCTLLLLITRAPDCDANPMPAVSEADLCNTGSMLHVTYVSYSLPRNGAPISYFNPPLAEYAVTDTVHGEPVLQSTIAVQYEFDDGSACLEPPEWQFDSAAMMPEAGSKWLLIVEAREDGSFQTFRGTVGRIPGGTAATQQIESCRPHWK